MFRGEVLLSLHKLSYHFRGRNKFLARLNGCQILPLRWERTHSVLVFVYHPLEVLLLLIEMLLLMWIHPVPYQCLAQLRTTVHSHSCAYLLLHGHVFHNPGLLILEKTSLWLGKLVSFCNDSVRGKLSIRRYTLRVVEVILRLNTQLGETTPVNELLYVDDRALLAVRYRLQFGVIQRLYLLGDFVLKKFLLDEFNFKFFILFLYRWFSQLNGIIASFRDRSILCRPRLLNLLIIPHSAVSADHRFVRHSRCFCRFKVG